ncbi:MAG: hypothetical protein U0556_00500 [Dehalococcoidia bacterium]
MPHGSIGSSDADAGRAGARAHRPTAFATELPPTNPPSVSLAQAAGTPCGPDQQAAGVYLYSEQSFGGKCAYFQIDLASANEWHIGNDQAQSVRIVGPNLTAILWKDVWFSGGGTLLTGPVEIPNLDSYPCDRTGCVSGKQASSLMVRFSQPDQPPPGVGSGARRRPARRFERPGRSSFRLPARRDDQRRLSLYPAGPER